MSVNTDDFKYEIQDDHVVITGYNGQEQEPVIPDMLDDLPVKEIDQYAFAGSDIERITIPEGIEHIGANAFAICEKLTAVNLPSTLERIDEAVFQGSELLNTITINDGNTRYDVINGILYDLREKVLILCPPALDLEYVQVMPGTKTIANAAFNKNQNLKTVELPRSLERIEAGAFLFADALQYLSIPPSVKSIDSSAFFLNKLQMAQRNFKLYCFENTYGYEYAVEQGIPVEKLYAYAADKVSEVKEETATDTEKGKAGNMEKGSPEEPEKRSHWKKLFG